MRRRDDERFDGVRITAHPRRGHLRTRAAIAAGLIALAVAGVTERRVAAHRAEPSASISHEDGAMASGANDGTRPGASPSRRTTANAMHAAPRDGEDSTPTLADYVLPGEAPAMADVIAALHARGIRTGLAAFPPPGTRPPLQGLEVPDGFALPPGYVRHHQATDDGQRIAPILMFSPDIDSIVIRGRRVPVPPDRVVTPELAPPGMPLRHVVIPAPLPGSHP